MVDDDDVKTQIALLQQEQHTLRESLTRVHEEMTRGFAAADSRHQIMSEIVRNVAALQERYQMQSQSLERAFDMIDRNQAETMRELRTLRADMDQRYAQSAQELTKNTEYINIWRGVAIALALVLTVLGGSTLWQQHSVGETQKQILSRLDKVETHLNDIRSLEKVTGHETPKPATP